MSVQPSNSAFTSVIGCIVRYVGALSSYEHFSVWQLILLEYQHLLCEPLSKMISATRIKSSITAVLYISALQHCQHSPTPEGAGHHVGRHFLSSPTHETTPLDAVAVHVMIWILGRSIGPLRGLYMRLFILVQHLPQRLRKGDNLVRGRLCLPGWQSLTNGQCQQLLRNFQADDGYPITAPERP